MKLRAKDESAFDLLVLGYEHPDVSEDTWDSNWLVVNGSVATGTVSWRFVEPCVATFELAELAEWLRSLKQPPPDASEHLFAEPHLAFSYQPAPQPTLRIRFAHGAAPAGGDNNGHEASVEFPLAEIDIDEAVADLRGALIDYPIRGGAA